MRSPAERLAKIIRPRLVARPEDLARMLGRGAITPEFIMDSSGSEEAFLLAKQIKEDLWPTFVHPTRRHGIRARINRANNPRVDEAKLFARWAKANKFSFEVQS